MIEQLPEQNDNPIEFSSDAQRVVAGSKDKSPEECLALIEAFLQGVDSAAESGQIVDSHGDQYNTEMINERLVALADQFNNPKVKKLDDPLRLVTSSNGLRGSVSVSY